MLQEKGVEMEFVERAELNSDCIPRAREADLVFNQKCLFRNGLQRRILKAAKRVIFDFDDAIWTRPHCSHSLLTRWRVQRRFRLWLQDAHPVIAANKYLADYARRQGAETVVIPMALDLQRWQPRVGANDAPIRIGWAGSPVNLKYLERIEPVLAQLISERENVQLHVYSGARPKLNIPYEYTPFAPDTGPQFTASLDIGLLPLEDDEYLKGKSPIKAVQYMACGVPVVGNAYGATKEILTPDTGIPVADNQDWQRALTALIDNRDLRMELGKAGRALVCARHDVRKVGMRLLDLIGNAQPKQKGHGPETA